MSWLSTILTCTIFTQDIQSVVQKFNVVGLIYMTWSAVKSRRMLVAHDIRKQESYRLNLP